MKEKIRIVPYQPQYAKALKALNYQWLEKYFRVEKGDEIALSNPQKEIIDKGGFIFFAQVQETIVGTVALLKKSDFVFELGKMAVSENHRGKGIGQQLLQYSINFAKEKHIRKIILYSNTRLVQALHLYQKFGFKEIPLEEGLYERADIKMELDIAED